MSLRYTGRTGDGPFIFNRFHTDVSRGHSLKLTKISLSRLENVQSGSEFSTVQVLSPYSGLQV